MDHKLRVITIIGFLLILVGLVWGLKSYGPNGNDPLDFFTGVYDGQEVSCNVQVDAELTGQPLRLRSVVCNKVESCITNLNPASNLFIGERSGSLVLQQSGKTYDTTSVEESYLSTTPGVYKLHGCVPEDATQVRVGILNDIGGVLNDQAVNIN
jgi:hypothetical protein